MADVLGDVLSRCSAGDTGANDPVGALALRGGISRSTLYRLFTNRAVKRHAALAPGSLERLSRLVREIAGEAAVRRFLEAMTPVGAGEVWGRYARWAEGRAAEPWGGPGTFWPSPPRGGAVRAVRGKAARRDARIGFAKHLARQVRKEVPLFAAFWEWMTERGVYWARQQIALQRVLAPFLAGPESGYVEVSWGGAPDAAPPDHRGARRARAVALVRAGLGGGAHREACHGRGAPAGPDPVSAAGGSRAAAGAGREEK